MWPDLRKQPLYAALVVLLLLGAVSWEVVGVANRMRQFRYVGQPVPATRQITVQGSGEVRVAPDVAIVTMGFTTQHTNLRNAQSEVNRKMSALIAAVKGAGVASEDMRTSEFSVTPQYTYEERQAPRITGYEARQAVEVRIRDLERIEAVIGAAEQAGPTNMSGLQFTVDAPERVRAEARAKAIAAARAEAMTIARGLDVRLGRVIAFDESGGNVPPMMLRKGVAALEADALPTIEPGTQEVTVRVSVTYEIE